MKEEDLHQEMVDRHYVLREGNTTILTNNGIMAHQMMGEGFVEVSGLTRLLTILRMGLWGRARLIGLGLVFCGIVWAFFDHEGLFPYFPFVLGWILSAIASIYLDT